MQASAKTREKECQAEPKIRSIKVNTGVSLMKAYLGEKAELIIKNTELNLTADK